MTDEEIRPAGAADAPAVAEVVDAAFRPCIERIGQVIAVHPPPAHGRGAGRRLLRFVDAHARALGLPEVRLCTNALMWENRKIYAKYGYEPVERRVDGPYDRIHYRKRLL
ncbi:GNAT family N-acetyltransferase [Streptomyces sp. NPDC093516]|uniref:GNAT family N-acetyltransferase n=1 Tax=Streptomyces sp. NPDC093516 TaxID=3155304 RepID=UPI00343FC31D